MCTREPRLVLVSLLNGWKNGARTLSQSLSEVLINQSNSLITFDTQLKATLVVVAKYSNNAAQQGQTKSILWHLWQPLYGPCMTLEHSFQPPGISCMLVFAEGEKPENPEKNRWGRVDNRHKLNSLMASGLRIEPGPYWWEVSALATTYFDITGHFVLDLKTGHACNYMQVNALQLV